MNNYRVRRRVIQQAALSLPRKGFFAKIGKWGNYFSNNETEKVASWCEKVWDNDPRPIDSKPTAMVYVLTMSGDKVAYASYKPIERKEVNE